jgi:hypothetical protein
MVNVVINVKEISILNKTMISLKSNSDRSVILRGERS